MKYQAYLIKFILCVTLLNIYTPNAYSQQKNIIKDTTHYKNISDTVTVVENVPHLQVIYSERESSFDWLQNIVFPVFMLLLGVFIDQFLTFRNHRKTISKEWKKWKTEITTISGIISKQNEEYSRFIKENEKNPNSFFDITLNLYLGIDGSNLDRLHKEDFEAYYNLKSNDSDAYEALQKLIGIISMIKICYKTIDEKYKEYKTDVQKKISRYNDILQDYEHKLYEILASNIISDDDKEILNQIYNVHIFTKSPYINPFELSQTAIRPSCEILSKYGIKTIEIVNTLNALLDKEGELQLEKHYLKVNILEIQKEYTKIIEACETIRTNMSNLDGTLNKHKNSTKTLQQKRQKFTKGKGF